jgi:hypothetical protein
MIYRCINCAARCAMRLPMSPSDSANASPYTEPPRYSRKIKVLSDEREPRGGGSVKSPLAANPRFPGRRKKALTRQDKVKYSWLLLATGFTVGVIRSRTSYRRECVINIQQRKPPMNDRKRKASNTPSDRTAHPKAGSSTSTAARKIHPIVIYPYAHPRESRHLEELYGKLIKRIAARPDKYARPLTVVNQQTYHRSSDNPGFRKLMREYVEPHSDILPAWSVDSCQMWLHGFGAAFDARATVYDVYWLIPGDFYYADKAGQEVLQNFEMIPDIVYTGQAEMCIGEISVSPNSSKQLIDTYGTYGLLYNWFPAEAQGLKKITEKPRSEFIAIGHDYLKTALISQRWYAYEQTIVILLQGMQGVRPMRSIKKIELGNLTDEPTARGDLAGAMQQVERTERVLKLYWRELKGPQDPMWPEKFRILDHQSEQIRGAAMVILQQILG